MSGPRFNAEARRARRIRGANHKFISPRFLGVLCVSALSCGLLYSQQLTCANGQCEGVIHGTAPACARLRIQAHGAVTLEGGGGKEISYTLRFAVSARGTVEAQRVLQASPVRIESQGPWTILNAPGGAVMSALSVDAPRLETAEIVTAVGAVRANGVAGTLEIHTGAGNIDVGRIGGAVRCSTGVGRVSIDSAGGAATLATNLGDIVAREAGGAVEARTGGGDVRIGTAGGPVSAMSGGGEISIGKAAGIVTLRNLAGPVQVGSAAGIRCDSASGGIRLSNIGGTIRVATSMGNILASLAGSGLSNSYMATGFGDITVLIPSNLGVTIQAEDDMADTVQRIVSDFAALQPRRQGTRIIAEGPINGGGPLLQISGMGGTIFIKRQ
jgi:DUF4097 and DUF4098 domain-containing protein YvlB